MMKCSSIERKLRKLEEILLVDESADDWIDIVRWEGKEGGAFGHVHWRFSPSRCEHQIIPCSDEEEIMIMRQQYESDNHRLSGREAEESFSEYLERFCNLGSEELSERRRAVIDRVRSEGKVNL